MSYLQFFLIYFYCTFLSFCAASVSSFIDKCIYHDRICLKLSSQKALPFFAAGLPEYGIGPFDPQRIGKITLNDGDLILDMKDIYISGIRKCTIIYVERDVKAKWLKISCKCPIQASGNYSVQGKLISVPIQGKGPFRIDIDKILIDALIDLDEIKGRDGQKHWTINKYLYKLDIKGATRLSLENLFNGDKDKAGPIIKIINQNGKILVQNIGKPLIDKLVDNIIKDLKTFAKKVPASELEY